MQNILSNVFVSTIVYGYGPSQYKIIWSAMQKYVIIVSSDIWHILLGIKFSRIWKTNKGELFCVHLHLISLPMMHFTIWFP